MQRDQLVGAIKRLRSGLGTLNMAERRRSLTQLEKRILSESFRVLVCGEFKSGKSTLINALIGRRILPSYAVPTTAIICEISFGEEPRAVLVRRHGNRTEKIPIQVEDLEKYVTIDKKNPEAENPYESAQLYWPLEICRNRVEIIDSPGLNEADQRQLITLGYLKTADAIVFVSDSQRPISLSEHDFIIDFLDAFDPFFVFNKINWVDENERADVKAWIEAKLADMRPDRVNRRYFVNAKAALDGAEDESIMSAYGVADFLRDLETFLGSDRNRIKIAGPAKELRLAIRTARRELPERRAMLKIGQAELQRRVDEAQGPLRELETQRQVVLNDLDIQLRDLADALERETRRFIRSVAAQLLEWAQTYSSPKRLSVNPLKAKESAKSFVEDVTQHLLQRTRETYREWQRKELAELLDSHVESMTSDLDTGLEGFEQRFNDVHDILVATASIDGDNLEDETEGTSLTKTLAAAGGFATATPEAALVGARLGSKTMLKSVVPSVAIGAAALILTPIGLLPLAAVLIGAGFLQAIIGHGKTEKKAKEKIAQQLADEMQHSAPDKARELVVAVMNELTRLRTDLADGLSTRINELRAEVDAVVKQKTEGETATRSAESDLDNLERLLNEVDEELDDLLKAVESTV
jgi:ribosome biogenesis GTPase A